MAARDIIVIGGSAGAVEAVQYIINALPPKLAAAIFVVIHIGGAGSNGLAQLFGRRAQVRVHTAEDGDVIRPGRVYIAPPRRHLTLQDGRVRVLPGPRENRHRPSIDVLFRSAARAYRERVIGVVLTGLLDDGAMGMRLIADQGGTTIVQDPDDALFPSMPRAAVEAGPDHVVPLADIPDLLVRLTAAETRPEEVPVARKRARSAASTPPERMGADTGNGRDMPGEPSAYTCPECHGTLWEGREGEQVKFNCRVGHAYTLASLVEEHSDTVERAMWIALRSLDEGAALAKRMADRARQREHLGALRRFEEQQQDKERDAAVLRGILLRNRRVTPEPEVEPEGGERRSA